MQHTRKRCSTRRPASRGAPSPRRRGQTTRGALAASPQNNAMRGPIGWGARPSPRRRLWLSLLLRGREDAAPGAGGQKETTHGRPEAMDVGRREQINRSRRPSTARKCCSTGSVPAHLPFKLLKVQKGCGCWGRGAHTIICVVGSAALPKQLRVYGRTLTTRAAWWGRRREKGRREGAQRLRQYRRWSTMKMITTYRPLYCFGLVGPDGKFLDFFNRRPAGAIVKIRSTAPARRRLPGPRAPALCCTTFDDSILTAYLISSPRRSPRR